MAKIPKNIIKEIRLSLVEKGFKKDIPVEVWNAEFMCITGYGKQKVVEWTDNFILIKLITVKEGKVNFVEGGN